MKLRLSKFDKWLIYITFFAVMFGIILPTLISSKSNEGVALGVVLLIATIYIPARKIFIKKED